MTSTKKLHKRQVPDELKSLLGDSLWWVEEDEGAWGRFKSNGPIHELFTYGQDWVNSAKNHRVCIQAGGNCGMYAKYYTNFFEEVYSFEPDPDNYKCLYDNLNGLNAKVYNNCLAKEKGIYSLNNSSKTNVGAFNVRAEECGGHKVQGITIDSFNLQFVDLIHLDVEGYEEDVLRGAKSTIDRCRPTIISEKDIHQYLQINHSSYKSKGKYHDFVFTWPSQDS